MKVPSGTNLEILSELPKFLEYLDNENKKLKRELVDIKKQNVNAVYDDSNVINRLSELERGIDAIEIYDDSCLIEKIESIRPYDDSELTLMVKESVSMSKRADSRFRNLASLVDVELRELNRLLKEAKYDDGDIKEDIKKALKFIDNFKPYNDEEIKRAINSIEPYNDGDIRRELHKVKSEIKSVTMELNSIKDSINNIKPYDDKFTLDTLGKINDRIDYIEKALGVK